MSSMNDSLEDKLLPNILGRQSQLLAFGSDRSDRVAYGAIS